MQMTLFAKWCRRSCYYFKMKLCICAEQIRALIERQESLYERKSELSAILEACKESGNEANNAASSAAENWSGEFEWDSEADDVRLNVFGISSYRANQREVITKGRLRQK